MPSATVLNGILTNQGHNSRWLSAWAVWGCSQHPAVCSGRPRKARPPMFLPLGENSRRQAMHHSHETSWIVPCERVQIENCTKPVILGKLETQTHWFFKDWEPEILFSRN
jgi:hypothetical protein